MSIASAITAAQGKVANAYTAVSSKGGTLPATQNLANLTTAINSIQVGASGRVLNFSVSSTGQLIRNKAVSQILDLSTVTIIGEGCILYQAYQQNTGISGSLDMSGIQKITGSSACYQMFNEAAGITSVDLSNLDTVSGQYACYEMFRGTSVASANLNALREISGSSGSCNGMFSGTLLTTMTFPSLSVITGSAALQNAFSRCRSLTSLYFPAVTTSSFGTRTNQFSNMCGSVPNVTLHFPSNVQSVIEGLTGYSTTAPFGATSGTVLFDLPATS